MLNQSDVEARELSDQVTRLRESEKQYEALLHKTEELKNARRELTQQLEHLQEQNAQVERGTNFAWGLALGIWKKT